MPKRGTTTRELGRDGERWAERYLVAQGLRTLRRNYHWPGGELDLVMRDERAADSTVVFVEVRYRASNAMIAPEATVDAGKRRRVVRSAQHYLARHADLAYETLRFDVVAVDGPAQSPAIRWYQAAFSADSG